MRNGSARLVVLALAVVVGVVILTKGLSGTPGGAVVPTDGGNSTESPSTSGPAPTGSTTGPDTTGGGDGEPTPQQEGVVVAIYNATSTDGLAGACEADLKKDGYVIAETGNFPPAVGTTIYYREGAQGKADAQHLKETAIPEAGPVKKLPAGLPSDTPIPKEAELVVVLGNDYAANHPVTG
jgi:hypothetical protein